MDTRSGAGPSPARSVTSLTSTRPRGSERPERWPRPELRFVPVFAMALVALALWIFYSYSQTIRIPFGIFRHPPLYGYWRPIVDSMALWMIPAGLLLAAVAWLVLSERVPSWFALSLIVVTAVGTAAAVAVVRGDWHELINGISTAPEDGRYPVDLHFVYEYGLRGFVERHAELIPQFDKWNSKTHPAGVLVLLYLLFELIGRSDPLQITTVLALISMCGAVAAWLIGRTIDGERAGRIAALLFVAAPGPLLLAYTSMDAIFATFLSMSAALFVFAIHRASPLLAAAAGALLAVATLMTYAAAFVLLAAALAVAVQSASIRGALKLLGAAAGGGVSVLVAARLTLGFDLLASYHATPRSSTPYDPYWALAHPAALLMWAGLPLATFGVAGLFLKVRDARRPLLPALLVTAMLIWGTLPAVVTGLRYGEVERTWAFLYPMLAAAAGPLVHRWIGNRWWSGAIVAALVILSVAQAAIFQALWDHRGPFET